MQNSGRGPGESLAWDRRGKPVAGWNDPVVAFHRLFSDDATPLAARKAALTRGAVDAAATPWSTAPARPARKREQASPIRAPYTAA